MSRIFSFDYFRLALNILVITFHFQQLSGECLSQTQNSAGSFKSVVAIAFYSLSRNFSLTLPSIQRRVFSVLSASNIGYDVFWYCAISASISNKRFTSHEIVNEFILWMLFNFQMYVVFLSLIRKTFE